MFAEPTGLFSGLVLDACAVCVPALSSLSLLGEQHSLAQWPCLPQLWHLPLRRRRFPSSGAVVESFFPPCPLAHLLFNRLASSHIWLTRALRLIEAELFMIRA